MCTRVMAMAIYMSFEHRPGVRLCVSHTHTHHRTVGGQACGVSTAFLSRAVIVERRTLPSPIIFRPMSSLYYCRCHLDSV